VFYINTSTKTALWYYILLLRAWSIITAMTFDTIIDLSYVINFATFGVDRSRDCGLVRSEQLEFCLYLRCSLSLSNTALRWTHRTQCMAYSWETANWRLITCMIRRWINDNIEWISATSCFITDNNSTLEVRSWSDDTSSVASYTCIAKNSAGTSYDIGTVSLEHDDIATNLAC